jgi:hypothetical protein
MTSTYLLVLAMSPTVFATQEGAKPVESTMAIELFTLERAVRQVPPDAEKLLRSAINAATTTALQTHRHPRTREEALAVLEAIQIVFIKHNFVQPPDEKDWPDTIGIALKPLTFKPGELQLQRILSHPNNIRRVKYLDLTKPLYYVDCDMGSQLFMAVGERLGWDVRLVELPQHNFVRWHLSESVKVNWDWTRWGSTDDGDYLGAIPSEDPRLHALYMRSLEPKEARAYYVGLIGSWASLPKDGERLFQEAIVVLPHHPLTLNNFAWLYATNPEFTKDKKDLAVAYSLAAWSMRPYHGNFADTVACSFAASGQKAVAMQIEEFAKKYAKNDSQRESFGNNLKRIEEGRPCK